MILDDPSNYNLALCGGSYQLRNDADICSFSSPASLPRVAKLYTLSQNGSLIYVGIATRRMSARLRYGFTAKGKSGYHGYKWKNLNGTLRLSIWTAKVNGAYVSLRELETVEAEVAFLCRHLAGQWPAHQHEIHFYKSEKWHREAAARIYAHAVRA